LLEIERGEPTNNSHASTKILIVDDDDNQLAAMRRTLHGHFEITAVSNPVHALKIFELQGPFAVVISDFFMPFMNGVQLLAKILEIGPHSQRILLTGNADLQMAIDAVNHGKIMAFLTKPVPNVLLRSVVRDAVQAYNQSRQSSGSFPPEQPAVHTPPLPAAENHPSLTLKEKEVLLLITKGFSNTEVSNTLLISVGTVKTHVNSLLGKLGVNNRTKAVTKAQEIGLIKTAPTS